MSAWVEPKTEKLALVNAKVALASFVGAKLHLFSNNFSPSEDSILADFTEVAYTGYAAQTVTWSAAFYDQNGEPVSSGGALLFIQTAVTVTGIAYGAYLTDTAGAVLLGAGRLDNAPFGFSGANVALELAIQVAAKNGVLTVVLGP